MTYNDLTAVPKLGQKPALKLLSNIDICKNCSVWRIINVLGILGISEQTAKDLAKKISSIHELSHATVEQLARISGIAQNLAKAIVKFFSDHDNQNFIVHQNHVFKRR